MQQGSFGNQQPPMMSQSQQMLPQQQQQQQSMMSQGQIISGPNSTQGGPAMNQGQRSAIPMQSGYRRGPSQGIVILKENR
jgi:hypothetical protein